MDWMGPVESEREVTEEGTGGRRSFVVRTLQALGTVAVLGHLRGRARADAPRRGEPVEPTPTGTAPDVETPIAPISEPEPAHQASFLDGLVGRRFRGCRVERVAPAHLGGAAIVLRGPEARFQIDILARGGAAGVAETEHYALFLANRGNGNRATDERHGLALMDVAAWLREREAQAERLPVSTLAERQAAHPRGNFLLP